MFKDQYHIDEVVEPHNKNFSSYELLLTSLTFIPNIVMMKYALTINIVLKALMFNNQTCKSSKNTY